MKVRTGTKWVKWYLEQEKLCSCGELWPLTSWMDIAQKWRTMVNALRNMDTIPKPDTRFPYGGIKFHGVARANRSGFMLFPRTLDGCVRSIPSGVSARLADSIVRVVNHNAIDTSVNRIWEEVPFIKSYFAWFYFYICVENKATKYG